MPWGLRRFHQSGQSHFVTFCCHRRLENLGTAEARAVFEAGLERVRRCYAPCVYGYVVMPEQVHLLISEPRRKTLAVVIQSLKQGVSRRLIGDSEHFWQHRYYDFNIRDYRQFLEKLRYIHRNPVMRGLCECPEQWPWSSYNHYATGLVGPVEIEAEWTANRRAREMGTLRNATELPPQASEA